MKKHRRRPPRAFAEGGLPQRALDRLAEVTGEDAKLFTSDLSVREFLLTEDANCKPITQVMGSSVYHIGLIPDYKGKTGEITTLSEGHRNARRRALSRLEQEAQIVGADAVIGVRIEERLITTGARGKGGDDGDEIIEFNVVGTAVRATWIDHPQGHPILTDLSGQDIWALHRDGFEPTGIVFDFCRYHVWHVLSGYGGSGEIPDAAAGVEAARALVEGRIVAQAEQCDADMVVGANLEFKVREVPCGWEGCPLNDLDVDVSWFATGIRRRENVAPADDDIPELLLAMVPIGRNKREKLLEGDDDRNLVAERAAEMEREAAREGGG